MKGLVFLGGTAANNDWRNGVIEQVTASGVPAAALFNPVVKEWNDEAQRQEGEAKTQASHLVFYIADPKQDGNPLSAYSMVEATMALYDQPDRTVVAFDSTGMTGHPAKAMAQACKALRARFPAAMIFDSQAALVECLIGLLREGA